MVKSMRANETVQRISLRRKERVKWTRRMPVLVEQYMNNCSFHGLRYVADPQLRPIERLLWLVLFASCAIYSAHVIYKFADEFQAVPTAIEIDSMTYLIAGVPFPSVTICPNDRADWKKVMALQRKILSGGNATNLATYTELLTVLSSFTFGDFDDLTLLGNRSIDALGDINLTELLMNVTPTCETLFSNCWWVNADRNCCEIFEVQRTEYGLCYSFNSEWSERRNRQPAKDSPLLRATSYGDWGGIKVTIHLGNMTKPPGSDEIEGIVLMINDPRTWPNSGNTIPAGSAQSVSVDCISGYATEEVLQLEESKMPCTYMKTGFYTQETCISICKRRYAVEACGCNPSIFFPPGKHRDCLIKDLPCLSIYNDLFNDYEVVRKEDLKKNRRAILKTMLCDCPVGCEYYAYSAQFAGVPIEKRSDIVLDIHFAGPTSARYKTRITFTKLELLVCFGGIISLFLGGSLLSAFELVYYLGVATFCYFRPCRPTAEKKVQTRRFTGAPILPVLDYGPAAQPAPTKPTLSVSYDRRIIKNFAAFKNKY